MAPKLPMRTSCSIWRISSSRIRVFHNDVAQCAIACQPLLVHPRQHWHQHIRVVVDLDFLLILMEPVETADILLQGSSPGGRHRKEKCVEARIIETLPKVASRRKNDTRFIEIG